MENYKTYIENLAKSKDGMMFQNSSPEHACIVMTTIFKNSEKDIRIFAGNLNGRVSNNEDKNLKKDYIDSLIKFIEEKKGNVKIILDEFDEKFLKSELFSKLQLYLFLYPKRVQIKKLNTSIFSDNEKEKFHFTVGDDYMFRFENDTNSFSALGSFNNKDFSQKLITFFDKNFNSLEAKPIIN